MTQIAPIQKQPAEVAKPPRLRIYADLSGAGYYRPSLMVLPWAPQGIDSDVLNSYANQNTTIDLVSLKDCHFAVLPFDAACLVRQPYGPADPQAIDFAKGYVARARAAKKPTIAVATGDSTHPLPMEFDVVLRHSIDRRRRKPGEYCLPGWFDAAQDVDPALSIIPRPAGSRPVVGFCGQAGPGRQRLRQKLRARFDAVRRPAGTGHDRVNPLAMRKKILDTLAASAQLDCNFVVREQFYAELENRNAARSVYINNIQNSDFVICVRGFGNYSFRLYDALSAGRVPILIDTDCVLPFDTTLRPSELFPIVPFDRLDELVPTINEYFAHHYRPRWHETQQRMRALYLEWFTPQAFFRRISIIPEIADAIRSSPGLRAQAIKR